MARDLLAEVSSPRGQLLMPERRRQLLQVAQELKDRLRFRCVDLTDTLGAVASGSSVSLYLGDCSQLYEEHHTHGVSPQQHGLQSIRNNSSVAQELKDRLNFRQDSYALSEQLRNLVCPAQEVFC